MENRMSLLVVEDDVITLEFLFASLLLKYPHFTVYKALNGRIGLEIFSTFLPDIVITDLNMPEMNGSQMIQQIAAIKPETKFIVLTGDSEKLAREGAAWNGHNYDYFIDKPILLQELFAVIEKCVTELPCQGLEPITCAP